MNIPAATWQEPPSALEDTPGQTEPTPQPLPAIDNAATLLADETITLPPLIIEDVLHRSLKGVLGSNSKARKTWILLALAISVATGTKFWKWNTRKGRVLYINFEIPRAFIRSRIKCLCRAKGVTDISNLDVWTLRGRAAPLWKLLPELIQRIQASNYTLAIIDPIYKGLGGRDENSAGDISELCIELERIAVETGAAVFFAAHFSKGNQASKEAIDRIGGSGVWTRDADTIITLTKHKVEGAFTVDLILRNLPEIEPFVVEWRFPQMIHNPNLHPEDLKQSGGRKREHEADELWHLLDKRSLTTTAWQQEADSDLGISRRTFYKLRKELEIAGRILKSKTNDKWTQVQKR